MVKGIHHISMRCSSPEEFEKVRSFYLDVIGLTVKREWNGACMIDTGAGLLEIMANGDSMRQPGTVNHFALWTDDVDGIVEKVRAAGYAVRREPVDIALPSDPPLPARIAFVEGPLGESIELFDEK